MPTTSPRTAPTLLATAPEHAGSVGDPHAHDEGLHGPSVSVRCERGVTCLLRRRLVRVRPPHSSAPGRGVWNRSGTIRSLCVERVTVRLRVVFVGITIVDTTAGLRVLETSHPPNYYFPRPTAVIGPAIFRGSIKTSWCEWKGEARYFSVATGEGRGRRRLGYPEPLPGSEALAGYYAFYPGHGGLHRRRRGGPAPARRLLRRLDHVEVSGPFKGEPGSIGW